MAPISDLQRFLEEIGFGAYKQRAYAALFRLGEGSVYRIGQQSGVPMPKVYEVMSELEAEGFVTLTLAKPKRYAMVHPGIIFSRIVAQREEELSRLRAERDGIVRLFDTLSRRPEETFEMIHGKQKTIAHLANELRMARKSCHSFIAFRTAATPLMPLIRRKVREGLDIRIVGPPANPEIPRAYLRLGARVRTVNIIKEPTRFSIIDGKRLAFSFVDKLGEYVTLWTDSGPLVRNMETLFAHYWGTGRAVVA